MVSSGEIAAAWRIIHRIDRKTPLLAIFRRRPLPVQSMNGSTVSSLASPEPRPVRGPDDSVECHRSTGSPSLVQFPGLAGECLVSQARIEARGRPAKRADSDDDSDDGGDPFDDADFADDGDFSDGDDSDDYSDK